ncbi:hypothetical protein KR52_11465 [Synechococcus sp. KORDI-52]|nr:hypothetical protein KR52_11465 [Synechococcus sp. KORDI-52]
MCKFDFPVIAHVLVLVSFDFIDEILPMPWLHVKQFLNPFVQQQ